MSPTPITENPRHSTGPRTPAGKAASSQNALRHGLASSKLLIPGEDAAAFHSLLADLTAEWAPITPTERLLVDSMAQHHWLANRALRLQSEALALAQPGELPPTFALLLRYQTTNERAFTQALRTLESLRKTRQQFVSQKEKEAEQTAERAVWEALSKPLPNFDLSEYLSHKPASTQTPADPQILR